MSDAEEIMKSTKLIQSKENPTLFLCECGQQVLEAYFDTFGYLHISGEEVCPKCGRMIDEDLLNEDEVINKDDYEEIASDNFVEWVRKFKDKENVFSAEEKG